MDDRERTDRGGVQLQRNDDGIALVLPAAPDTPTLLSQARDVLDAHLDAVRGASITIDYAQRVAEQDEAEQLHALLAERGVELREITVGTAAQRAHLRRWGATPVRLMTPERGDQVSPTGGAAGARQIVPGSLGSIHHVGVVVDDLDAALASYHRLGFQAGERTRLPDQNVEVAALRAGDNWIELLSPIERDSPIGHFLESRGQGVHHIAYEVADVGATLAALDAAGVELIDREPRSGLHGWRIAFIHPRSCAGVLTELVERGNVEHS